MSAAGEIKFSIGNNNSPGNAAAPNSPPSVKFEMGGADVSPPSKDGTPSITLDLDGEEDTRGFDFTGGGGREVKEKRRHLSDNQSANSQHHFIKGPQAHSATAARRHWVSNAPRGSLEIRRSPCKDLGLNKTLPQNRSDSRLSARRGSAEKNSRRRAKMSAGAMLGPAEAAAAGGAVGGAAGSGGGGMPRTLSTSVLRIKHKRSFWEKVIG